MLINTFIEFIKSGIEKNTFMDIVQFLRSLVIVKYLTVMDRKNSELSKMERKQINGFSLPHTASFDYIMKYIDSDRLYDIINDSFTKIEKRNNHFQSELAIRKEVNVEKINKEIKNDIPIKKIRELNLDSDLVKRLLNAINKMNDEEGFKLAYNFIFNDVYDLINEHEKSKRENFERNRRIIFKGDVPISVNNSVIFDKTFIVEQWVRRIIMFILMTEYGSGWIKAFGDKDLEEYEEMRRRLSGREVLEFKDDHLLWYANISYLGKFIKRKDIKEKFEKVTDIKAKLISNAVFKIGDIRNEMAHNRTITKLMEEDYNSNFKTLEEAITNFKKKTIYSKDGKIVSGLGILSSKPSEFVKYFNNLSEEQFNAIGTQSIIIEEENYYSIILLPCKPLGAEFIDIRSMLERFDIFKDHIIAFYINKEGGEYQIIVSKKMESEKTVYRVIMKTFFEIVRFIGTDNPYTLQDSKYTCNPKIWFYEISYEEGLNNGLW